MQAVKGVISNGRFMPTDGVVLPNLANAMLVLGDVITKPPENFLRELDRLIEKSVAEENNARIEWLNRLKQARLLAADEILPDFPTRQSMGEPHGLTD
jgi:hypothetical protein